MCCRFTQSEKVTPPCCVSIQLFVKALQQVFDDSAHKTSSFFFYSLLWPLLEKDSVLYANNNIQLLLVKWRSLCNLSRFHFYLLFELRQNIE